jgi:hypothetical protein
MFYALPAELKNQTELARSLRHFETALILVAYHRHAAAAAEARAALQTGLVAATNVHGLAATDAFLAGFNPAQVVLFACPPQDNQDESAEAAALFQTGLPLLMALYTGRFGLTPFSEELPSLIASAARVCAIPGTNPFSSGSALGHWTGRVLICNFMSDAEHDFLSGDERRNHMFDLEERLRDEVSGGFNEWHSFSCPVCSDGPDHFMAEVECGDELRILSGACTACGFVIRSGDHALAADLFGGQLAAAAPEIRAAWA